jgi:hypothetical protein
MLAKRQWNSLESLHDIRSGERNPDPEGSHERDDAVVAGARTYQVAFDAPQIACPSRAEDDVSPINQFSSVMWRMS